MIPYEIYTILSTIEKYECFWAWKENLFSRVIIFLIKLYVCLSPKLLLFMLIWDWYFLYRCHTFSPKLLVFCVLIQDWYFRSIFVVQTVSFRARSQIPANYIGVKEAEKTPSPQYMNPGNTYSFISSLTTTTTIGAATTGVVDIVCIGAASDALLAFLW